MGKYNGGNTRPIKVRIRLQLAVEEIIARASRILQNADYKDVWITRDMNLEERQEQKYNKLRKKTYRGQRPRRRNFIGGCYI